MGSNPIEDTRKKFLRCTWENHRDCAADVRIINFLQFIYYLIPYWWSYTEQSNKHLSPDLTLSFLGNETGLISSFLSSDELGELLDKVRIMNWPSLFYFFCCDVVCNYMYLSTDTCFELSEKHCSLLRRSAASSFMDVYLQNWVYVGVIKCTPILIGIANKLSIFLALFIFYLVFFFNWNITYQLASRSNHGKLN